MSQFFAYSQAAYVHQMRRFLGQRHPAQELLVRHRPEGSQGRAPNYPPEVVAVLEQAVNDKAATCEAADTAFCERLQWACDYAGVKDSALARALGVSRQLVSGWKRGAYHPARLDALAEELNVSRAWLQHGGEHSLLACSHIGARVGEEGLKYREELYGGTLEAIEDVLEEQDEYQVNACLEQIVLEDARLSRLARRAGGRWLLRDGAMLFVPWVPIYKHELTHRHWPDEVEAIIDEELERHGTVYAAWQAIKQCCKDKGLAYPQKISLYKRVEKSRHRLAEFGADAELSESIASNQGQ